MLASTGTSTDSPSSSVCTVGFSGSASSTRSATDAESTIFFSVSMSGATGVLVSCGRSTRTVARAV